MRWHICETSSCSPAGACGIERSTQLIPGKARMLIRSGTRKTSRIHGALAGAQLCGQFLSFLVWKELIQRCRGNLSFSSNGVRGCRVVTKFSEDAARRIEQTCHTALSP